MHASYIRIDFMWYSQQNGKYDHKHTGLELQRQNIKLEPDEVFPGMQRVSSYSVSVNRLSANMGMENSVMKVSTGAFASGLQTALFIHVLQRKFITPFAIFFAAVITFSILVYVFTKRPWLKYITVILCTIVFVVGGCLLLANRNYSAEALFSKRLNEIVRNANLITVSLAATMPYKLESIEIRRHSKSITFGLKSTLGHQWMNAMRHNVPVTFSKQYPQLIKAISDDTQSATLIAGQNDHYLSNRWTGQLLCLSYGSRFADVVHPDRWRRLPAWLHKYNNPSVHKRLVVFDFSSSSRGEWHNTEFWNFCHTIVSCNGAFPPCYAFVSINDTNPAECELRAVEVDGRFYNKHDPEWFCCKSVALFQFFILISRYFTCAFISLPNSPISRATNTFFRVTHCLELSSHIQSSHWTQCAN